MSTVETWSIWMATLSFIQGPWAAGSGSSVKPAAQFLQQRRGALLQAGVDVPAGGKESFEGRDGRPALVEPGIELARLEQELGPVGRNGQHLVEGTGGARPVLLLGEP